MILKRLYTQPTNLFETVEFRPGLNFIYGIKDNPLESNESLNAIGKSLFLDFLDFALLAHFNSAFNTRLARAYKSGIIDSDSVIIEFEIDSKEYYISRFFNDPTTAYFSETGKAGKKHKISSLREHLYEMVFKRENYTGVQKADWYLNIIGFFLKIQKASDEKFTNPIRFVNTKEDVLNQYHLFLLDIDNSVSAESDALSRNLDEYKKTIKITRELLAEGYSIKDFPSVYNEITRLDNLAKRAKKSLDSFNFADEYKNLEKKADQLTTEIKELTFFNSADQTKINDYKETLNKRFRNSETVREIYSEIEPELGDFIKNELDEAIIFREQLINSRKDFFDEEIRRLQTSIYFRNDKLEKKGKERAEIFNELSNKEALKDLTGAYAKLNRLEKQKADLQAKLDLYRKSQDKIKEIKNRKAQLPTKVNKIIKNNEKKISDINEIIADLYENIFGTKPEGELFNIIYQEADEKMKLSVLPEDKFSHGKNQGRTLIYDLAVLMYMMKNKIKGPRFLVHDSIFDSLDKTHLKNLYEFMEKKEEDFPNLQYIITLNQQDDLHEKIQKRTVLPINASERLLGEKF